MVLDILLLVGAILLVRFLVLKATKQSAERKAQPESAQTIEQPGIKPRRNIVALVAALLNLGSGALLICGQMSEGPDSRMHRMGGSGSILFLMWPLGLLFLILGLSFTISALIKKEVPKEGQPSIPAKSIASGIFSLVVLGITVLLIQVVAK
jgi:hypothetical protein